jgi:hypothetical protein
VGHSKKKLKCNKKNLCIGNMSSKKIYFNHVLNDIFI